MLLVGASTPLGNKAAAICLMTVLETPDLFCHLHWCKRKPVMLPRSHSGGIDLHCLTAPLATVYGKHNRGQRGQRADLLSRNSLSVGATDVLGFFVLYLYTYLLPSCMQDPVCVRLQPRGM